MLYRQIFQLLLTGRVQPWFQHNQLPYEKDLLRQLKAPAVYLYFLRTCSINKFYIAFCAPDFMLAVALSLISAASLFVLSNLLAILSTRSLNLLFSDSAASELFVEILRLVSGPLSGANKIPKIAPAAAPAITPNSTLEPEFIYLFLV